jgi:trigger factor
VNIQTERLENHTARFTVEVEVEQLEQAKKDAARKLARRVNVPGFRKGKAPYKVLVSYLGEGPILEDAIEALGNTIYKDALDNSDIEPYGPGELEDVELDPQPVFKFVVPLRPTVDLGDYRDVRVDYETPTVEDEAVDNTLKAMQEREALIEESSRPVAAGNRVTVDIRGEYLDGGETEAEESDTEAEEAAESEDAEEPAEPENEVFIDREDLVFSLTEDREPAPGFTDALVGAEVDEEREFEIEYPDDEAEYEHLAGRRVKFWVKVKKIETMTLPELNDDFAARVSEDDREEGEEPLTLLQLRMKIREDLQESAEEQTKAEYGQEALDKMIEQATFGFPDALVSDQVHHLLHHLDNDLRQRGLTLDDYMKVSGKSHEDLHEDYHDTAVATIKRSLLLGEMIRAEQITVMDEDLDAEIDRISAQFGEQAGAFRSIYNNASMRDNLHNDLLNRRVMDRVVSIAKGEAPALADPTPEVMPETNEEDTPEEGDSAS